MDKEIGSPISLTAIVDIMNLIGSVVAGNVRRTAEIVFDPHDSEEYIDLKNYEVNPHRAEYGWTSNNSIYAELGMDYTESAQRIKLNGEPGFAWLGNMQKYGRMADEPNWKDHRACGGNPCLEQTLESYELCCLVETFPTNHDSIEDYLKTLKYAYLYAKTVTLGKPIGLRPTELCCETAELVVLCQGNCSIPRCSCVSALIDWMDAGYQHMANLR